MTYRYPCLWQESRRTQPQPYGCFQATTRKNTLNKCKGEYGKTRLEFFGCVFSDDGLSPGSGFARVTVHPENARFQNLYRHVFQLLEKCTQSERKSCFLVTLISICCRKLDLQSDQVITSRIFATNSASRTQHLLLQELQLQQKHCWMLYLCRILSDLSRVAPFIFFSSDNDLIYIARKQRLSKPLVRSIEY